MPESPGTRAAALHRHLAVREVRRTRPGRGVHLPLQPSPDGLADRHRAFLGAPHDDDGAVHLGPDRLRERPEHGLGDGARAGGPGGDGVVILGGLDDGRVDILLDVPGAINVREIMSGRGDLRITAVGTDTADLTRIAQAITARGIEIDDQDLIHREYFSPYARFGPPDEQPASPVTGVAGLADDADGVEIIVGDDAPIAGNTLATANDEGLVTSDTLVVRINRDEETITPTGETPIQPDDFVTIHSRSGVDTETLEAFTGEGAWDGPAAARGNAHRSPRDID